MQKKSGIMKSGLDTRPLFLLDDLLTHFQGEYTGIGAEIEDRPENVHATQKVILDIFKHKTCHKLFYTNDLYVLIDIIVRYLKKLSNAHYYY